MKLALWSAVALAIFPGCGVKSFIATLPDDNFIEERLEDIVEDFTGIKADFTGKSPE